MATLLLVGILPGTDAVAVQPIGLTEPTAGWGPLRTLVTDREGINQVRLVLLPDGTTTVVWVEDSDVDTPPAGWNHRVMAVDVGPDSVSSPTVLGGVPGSIIDSADEFAPSSLGEAGGLQVGLDHAGNITVTWSEERRPDGTLAWGPHVLSVTRPADGEWTEPELLSGGSVGRGAWPKLAVDASGAALVAWEPFSRRGLFTTYRPPGGDWQAPLRLERNRSVWSIGIDAAGVVTFLGTHKGRVGARRLVEAGTRWSAETTFGAREVGPLDLAVNRRGEIAAVWPRTFGPPHGEGRAHVGSNRRPADGGWRGVASIPPTTRFDSLRPTVVMDRRGRATATWVQGRDDRVQVVRSTRSGRWRRTKAFATGAYPSWHRANALAGNRRGSVLVAWTVLRHIPAVPRRRVRIDAAYRPVGGPWFQLPLASPATRPPVGSYSVATAVRPMGGAVLVWPTSRGRRLVFRELFAPH